MSNGSTRRLLRPWSAISCARKVSSGRPPRHFSIDTASLGQHRPLFIIARPSFLIPGHIHAISPILRDAFLERRNLTAARYLSSEGTSAADVSEPPKDLGDDQRERRDVITVSILNGKENSIGFMTRDKIEEVEWALLSWTKEITPEGYEKAMSLLKRLIQEQEQQPVQTDEDSYYVRPYVVNRVVDCWRICWCSGTSDVRPSVMLTILGDLDVAPDSRALTMVIDAMLKRGDPAETPMVAQWILDQQMEAAEDDVDLRPDSFLLTSVIRAWAKSRQPEGPEMAEAILDLMHDLYDNGWENSGPNLVSYESVMNAWNNSRHPDAPKAMDRLLDRMSITKSPVLLPDSFIYTLVIDAWSHSRAFNATQKAKARLDEMIELYMDGSTRVQPSAGNFARVIHALARNGEGREAEVLYGKLQSLYKETQNPAFRPNHECDKALLSALSRKETSRQAHVALEVMIKAALAGEGQMPKRSYFIDVLVALTKERNPYFAAKNSEKLLRRMVDLASSGFPNLMPDSTSFFKVVRAWSKCRDKEAVSNVMSLLKLLEDLHVQYDSDFLKPTCMLMECVVLTLCRSSDPEALHRAETIVSDMEKVYSNGDKSMKPRRGIYTTLMQAWVKSGNPKSNDAVKEIFDKLSILFAQGHSDYRPDLVVYSTLMASLAESGDSAKVQAIFDLMCEEFVKGHVSAKPDMHAFNMILKSWSFSESPNRGYKAESTLNRLEDINKTPGLDLKPDAYTYLHMIRIWTSTQAPENAERAEHYLRAMVNQSFVPSFSFYFHVIRLWLQKGEVHCTGRAAVLVEDLIERVQSRQVRAPTPAQYRQFLELIADSSIEGRNAQAKNLLGNLSPHQVPSKLLK